MKVANTNLEQTKTSNPTTQASKLKEQIQSGSPKKLKLAEQLSQLNRKVGVKLSDNANNIVNFKPANRADNAGNKTSEINPDEIANQMLDAANSGSNIEDIAENVLQGMKFKSNAKELEIRSTLKDLINDVNLKKSASVISAKIASVQSNPEAKPALQNLVSQLAAVKK
jgi:hypothetical protein